MRFPGVGHTADPGERSTSVALEAVTATGGRAGIREFSAPSLE
jgi:hypothetical protein